MAQDTEQGRFFFVKFNVEDGRAVAVISPDGKPLEFGSFERAATPIEHPVEVVLVHRGSYCIRRGDGSIVCF